MLPMRWKQVRNAGYQLSNQCQNEGDEFNLVQLTLKEGYVENDQFFLSEIIIVLVVLLNVKTISFHLNG